MDYRPTTIESNERGWRDAFVGPFVFLALVSAPIGWLIYFVRRSYSLRTKGFWAGSSGRDAIEYQELHDGRLLRLRIDREMITGAPDVIYVPTEGEWKQQMPKWAQGRREEIIAKMKRTLGTKRYEYDYS